MDEIIKCVRDHPILYENKKTPNSVRKKKENWEEIALDLGQSVEAIKRKWAYLRENYQKCIKEGKENKWQWGKDMEFLRPHLKNSKDDKNTTADQELISEILNGNGALYAPQKERRMSMFASRPFSPMSEDDNDDDDDYAKPMQTPVKIIMETPKAKSSDKKKTKSEKKVKKLEQSEYQTPEQKPTETEQKVPKSEKKSKKSEQKNLELAHKRDKTNLEKANIEPTPKKPRVMNSGVESDSATNSTITPWNPSFDATELLFLSYAKTLKSFAPKNQAVAKMKIAKIILEQELLHCDQDERRDSFLEGF